MLNQQVSIVSAILYCFCLFLGQQAKSTTLLNLYITFHGIATRVFFPLFGKMKEGDILYRKTFPIARCKWVVSTRVKTSIIVLPTSLSILKQLCGCHNYIQSSPIIWNFSLKKPKNIISIITAGRGESRTRFSHCACFLSENLTYINSHCI